MLSHIAVSFRSLFIGRTCGRDLCRLDCRCLEDIGLHPGDVVSTLNRFHHGLKHHPSWDGEVRNPVHGPAPRLD